MRRFKIGDKVRIARIAEQFNVPKYQGKFAEWSSMIGQEYVIIGYDEMNGAEGYELDITTNGFWLDEELEPCKESKVHEILKNYVAFKKKASDNKGRNQSKKANGKPKVSKSAKTT